MRGSQSTLLGAFFLSVLISPAAASASPGSGTTFRYGADAGSWGVTAVGALGVAYESLLGLSELAISLRAGSSNDGNPMPALGVDFATRRYSSPHAERSGVTIFGASIHRMTELAGDDSYAYLVPAVYLGYGRHVVDDDGDYKGLEGRVALGYGKHSNADENPYGEDYSGVYAELQLRYLFTF